MPIYGGNAEIDLLALVAGQFADGTGYDSNVGGLAELKGASSSATPTVAYVYFEDSPAAGRRLTCSLATSAAEYCQAAGVAVSNQGSLKTSVQLCWVPR
jgi:hypothetical protein